MGSSFEEHSCLVRYDVYTYVYIYIYCVHCKWRLLFCAHNMDIWRKLSSCMFWPTDWLKNVSTFTQLRLHLSLFLIVVTGIPWSNSIFRFDCFSFQLRTSWHSQAVNTSRQWMCKMIRECRITTFFDRRKTEEYALKTRAQQLTVYLPTSTSKMNHSCIGKYTNHPMNPIWDFSIVPKIRGTTNSGTLFGDVFGKIHLDQGTLWELSWWHLSSRSFFWGRVVMLHLIWPN